ncbi:unnamed protein product [Prunus armeniaca]|uniref:Uncharacterized protein n=1 Tax=Prunus armeniaca TaxID=36596 RepID=A0A6J5TXY3_PRUAR|nr:unnamed protein product [Prunus armeniaca]
MFSKARRRGDAFLVSFCKAYWTPMGPLTLAVDSKSCSGTSSNEYSKKTQYAPIGTRKSFASVSLHEDKPFDFLRTLLAAVH